MFRKKGISFFLIIYLVFFQFISIPQKTYAAFPLLPIVMTPVVKGLVGASLIAAGLFFRNNADLTTATNVFWNTASNTVRQTITDIAMTQSSINSATLQTVQSIVDPWFNTVVTQGLPIQTHELISWNNVAFSTFTTLSGGAINHTNVGTYKNIIDSLLANQVLTIHYLLTLPNDAELSNSNILLRGQFGPSSWTPVTPSFGLAKNHLTNLQIRVQRTSSGFNFWYWFYNNGTMIWTNFGGTAVASADFYIQNFESPNRITFGHQVTLSDINKFSINATNSSMLTPNINLPEHKNKLNNWEILIPPALLALFTALNYSSLINRTHENLITDGIITDLSIPVTPPVTLPEGFLGTISAIYQGILAIPTSIARFFDLTIPLNFAPLQVAGTMFTTRFPFSIPWDIARAFDVSSAAGMQAPYFDVNIDTGLLGRIQFRIDFTAFQHLIAIQRDFLIILFIIGLAVLTPKIIKS